MSEKSPRSVWTWRYAETEIERRQAFDLLYEEWLDGLLAFVYSLTRDWSITEDIVQDAFLCLYRRREAIKSLDNIRGYLTKIAANRARDLMRRRDPVRSSTSLSPKEVGEAIQKLGLQMPSQNGLDEQLHATDLLERVLRSVSDQGRELLYLLYFGYTLREIAEILAISLGAAKNRIYRLKMAIRSKLEG